MQLTVHDFIGILPEFFLLCMAAVILLTGLFAKKDSSITYYLTQLSLLGALALVAWVHAQPIDSIFQGGMVLDALAYLLKSMIYAASFFVFLYSRHYLREHKIQVPEYYVLGLLSITGMSVLVSGHHLLVIYLALELFSLPIYAMVAMQRKDANCIEAALKYFVMGAVASGFILYGMSLYFGATGTLDLSSLSQHITNLPARFDAVLMVGLVFMLAGMLFKLGAAPFHMWVPDVYAGAPACVTLFISVAPKLAALGLMARLLLGTSQDLLLYWQHILIVVAVLSMAVGNLVAIVQVNFKRMLAYSSIAHIGYMLLGFLCGTRAGNQASVFYMITYALMSLGSFGFIVMLSRDGVELNNISDLAGLNQRHPWFAFLIMLLMFSLAGIPPLVGFMAKVAVLEALVDIHLVWLATAALLFSVVGSFYYLRVVKVMYFEEPVVAHPVACSADGRLALSINAIAVLALGIFPGVLLHLCQLVF